ncbi:MAG: hypothetical protein LKF75_02240 [Bacilli bacterium]|nr:hypothetical protein [Bacilli bacterium]MCH4210981.1 hypothetical protein [Bacilli bacterium]MCH4228508.1 hypothetical protein [Bacilli bacterium]MCH4277790.1 hypothetical protein [Bacilli bacterium]
MEKYDRDNVQAADYKIALKVCWTVFGITLALASVFYPLGIVSVVNASDGGGDVSGGVLTIVGGGLMFLASMVFLGFAIHFTTLYKKAKKHIKRSIIEDPGNGYEGD